MNVSPSRRLARQALEKAAKQPSADGADVAAVVGVGMALLELAYQVGRLADQAPIYGPPEEQ